MLKSLRIRNYRVFKDLKVDGLHRINLIAGKNNSGKTSFLEAIFLLSSGGNPQLAINSNVIRGDPGAAATMEAIETDWKYLFHNLGIALPIEIEGHHSEVGQMRSSISLERAKLTHLPITSTGRTSLADIDDGRAIVFRYSDPDHPCAARSIRVTPNGLEAEQSSPVVPFNVRIVLSHSGNEIDEARLLGNLRTRKKGDLLLRSLRAVEPRLESVEDSIASGVPAIWGDAGLTELVPLRVMGEGITRLARIVLCISSAPGGIVLVDEIENGFHHSVMAKVWKAIALAAEEFDAQVFATTHSFECIETAHEGLGLEGFRLYRLSNRGGTNRAVRYKPDEVELAIRRGLEVR